MGRPTRDFTTADRFHVINRGVDGQDLFSIEDDWVLFESLIGRICGDYSFVLNAYALMSNHYHFMVDLSSCDERASVSLAIGVLQSTYAKYFNERTSRHGPLFDPRFLAYGVADEVQIHRTLRYIHRNPIDLCGSRGLGSYRWSSLPVFLGRRRAPDWLDCDEFVPQNPTGHLAELAECGIDDLSPLHSLPPLRTTSLEEIAAAIVAVEHDGDGALGSREKREVLLMLALELRVADVVVAADHFGLSEARIRQLAKRAQTRRHDDRSFDRLAERVRHHLTRR